MASTFKLLSEQIAQDSVEWTRMSFIWSSIGPGYSMHEIPEIHFFLHNFPILTCLTDCLPSKQSVPLIATLLYWFINSIGRHNA